MRARKSFRLCALSVLCGAVVGADVPREAPSVRWTDGAAPRVEVRGVGKTARPESVLRVYAIPPGVPIGTDTPAMAGEYRADGGLLVFEPQFPPQPRVTYRAELKVGERRVVADFVAPAPPAAAATVITQVYPSADKLPENLLKFYVHFSAPMRRGRIYDHIRLLDDSGKPVELPFLEIGEELWDPTMTRLTLFIDPGRIKRGVQPLEEVGPALMAGRHYRLTIDAAWKDAAGNPLARPFEKRFEVGPADRDPPDPAKWTLSPPASGGRQPLTVDFGKPMDHALALRLPAVEDPQGEPISGRITLDDLEKRWHFAPDRAWLPGRHHLLIPATIEDLAGNNVGKPFDVDLAEGTRPQNTPPVIRLPFEVR